jgi:2-C-methyl-D-erythritol 2,4-cyclodiphosphate synthase
MHPKFRIGNGIDFHKLEINSNRNFILGGYKIETEYALIGHSDADILIHALSDAILGALGLADIGKYFPDTDSNLKNMDSTKILLKAVELMNEKKYHLLNIDNTIICEKPKISPHREKIIQSLSKILNLQEDCIGVKATTTEKMGALGREEGVAVFSTVMLESNQNE